MALASVGLIWSVTWTCEVLEVLLTYTKSARFIPRITDVELGKFKLGQS